MTQYIAWHVGRSGEVAGGMTQVVNGYLSWDFDDFETRVITSRDGSHGPRAILIFVRALITVLRLKNRDTSVVVVHLSQGGSFVREGLLLRLARKRGFATVGQLHGSSFADFAARKPRLVSRVLSRASRILVLSDESRELAVNAVGAERVVQLPNAVPPSAPTPKEKLVVFGGAVTYRKGVDVLVEAWRLVGVASGWKLFIAGPLTDRELVPTILPGASFLGALEHRDLMALLDRSAIAVLPSRDEAMPMFILEAMARDNCVIATPVGGITDVLADGRGVLVEPGDVEELAAAVKTAFDDEAGRIAIAASGRSRFDEQFSSAVVYPRIESLWHDALASR
ncbi:MAG: glycosyltransferase family 4 protein [Rhodoglobus sp.]